MKHHYTGDCRCHTLGEQGQRPVTHEKQQASVVCSSEGGMDDRTSVLQLYTSLVPQHSTGNHDEVCPVYRNSIPHRGSGYACIDVPRPS